MVPGGRRRRLRRGDVLLGPGALPAPRVHTASYRQGYLHGLVRADTAGRMRVRDGRIDQAFPSERLELEALGRAHHLLAVEAADHGPSARRGPRGSPDLAAARGGPSSRRPGSSASALPGRTAVPRSGDAGRGCPQRSATRPASGPAGSAWRPPDPDDDWCAGLLGGMADAAGITTEGVLRLSTADEELVGLATGALHRLGFSFVVEKVEAGRPGTPGARCTPRA